MLAKSSSHLGYVLFLIFHKEMPSFYSQLCSFYETIGFLKKKHLGRVFTLLVLQSKRQWDIWRHQLSHTKERPYLCDICDEGFREKNKLSHHCRVRFFINFFNHAFHRMSIVYSVYLYRQHRCG